MRNYRGFSLSELSVAIVILLIISSITALSYFSQIDNANATRNLEQSKHIKTALLGSNMVDFSDEYDINNFSEEVKLFLAYHINSGTAVRGVPFNDKVVKTKGKEYLGGLVKDSDLNSNNVDFTDIKVRKIDKGKLKGKITGEINGDWFIIVNENNQVKEDN